MIPRFPGPFLLANPRIAAAVYPLSNGIGERGGAIGGVFAGPAA
jgi:hypothetical protein